MYKIPYGVRRDAHQGGWSNLLGLLRQSVCGVATALALLAAFSAPVLADGGAGGLAVPGGTGSATGTGGAGGTASSSGKGGGGGGAGVTGGAGGANIDPGGGAGGAGGTAPGGAGANGGDSSSTGAGGGGGGAHGAYVTSSTSNSGTLTGGNGGNGGSSSSTGGAGFGGGGGEGGYGAVVNGSGVTLTNSGTIAGGTGGTGGNSSISQGGAGGDGGIGAYVTGGGALSNSGSVTGGTGGNGTLTGPLGGTTNIPGNGGAGAAVVAGTLFNSGSITGGTGGPGIFNPLGPSVAGGNGGAGVIGSDATVINNGSINGGLSGADPLSGTHTRANAITFTGGTNILELWSGSTITGNVVAVSGGSDTLRLGGSTDASFDVSLIGTQYVNFANYGKTGSSTWTLTGTNSAALPWTVSGGALAVNGVMSGSTFTVNSGGTLSGTGTIGTVSVAGGVYAPGDGTVGSTQTVGTLGFASGGTYRVFLSPSASSFATVTGTATLAGAVNASFASGSYIAKQYDILKSAGLGGTTFATLTTTNLPAGFLASLSYTATDVLLNLAVQLGFGTNLAGNPQAVANAINTSFSSGVALPPAFANLSNLTGTALSNALSQNSGEAATGAQDGGFQFMSEFFGLMLDRDFGGEGGASTPFAPGYAAETPTLPDDVAHAYAAALKAPSAQVQRRWRSWASGFGGYNKTSGDAAAGSNDVTARTYGGAAGLDYRFTADTVVGFALAGGGTNWGLAQGLGGGRSDAFQAGLYGRTNAGAAYVGGALAVSGHRVTTDRYAYGGDHLTAGFNAYGFGGRLETGYRIGAAALSVTPYAAIQAQSFHTPGYSETDVSGGGFALTYGSATATDTRSELGASFARSVALSEQALLTLRVRLGWVHDWASDPSLTAAFQALPGSSFIVNGAAPPKNSALVSGGAEMRLADGFSFLAKFDGDFGRGSQTYGGTGTLRYTW